MRPGLPVWWDAPAAFPDWQENESNEDVLFRTVVEHGITEPILVHIRPLCKDGLSAERLAEQNDFDKWNWAKLWNAKRRAIAEDLLRVQNDDHAEWLAKIDPPLGNEPLSAEDKKRRGQSFRDFRDDPYTLTYLRYMKDTVGDLMFRLVRPGYTRPW